jgi:hypothetical protein
MYYAKSGCCIKIDGLNLKKIITRETAAKVVGLCEIRAGGAPDPALVLMHRFETFKVDRAKMIYALEAKIWCAHPHSSLTKLVCV